MLTKKLYKPVGFCCLFVCLFAVNLPSNPAYPVFVFCESKGETMPGKRTSAYINPCLIIGLCSFHCDCVKCPQSSKVSQDTV